MFSLELINILIMLTIMKPFHLHGLFVYLFDDAKFCFIGQFWKIISKKTMCSTQNFEYTSFNQLINTKYFYHKTVKQQIILLFYSCIYYIDKE